MTPRDFDGIIRLVNNSFLAEGDGFPQPLVVLFPFIPEGGTFEDGYSVAAAIISSADKSRFDMALASLNSATDLAASRKALRKMPKHLFVASIFRSTFATGADGIVNEFRHEGEFSNNLRTLVTEDEISLQDLQTAVDTACGGKKIVAHRQCFLISAKGRKYPFYDFDLE